MKLPSFRAIFRTAKKEVGLAQKSVESVIAKVSPFILQEMKPILATAGEDLWKTAYPIAVGIVHQLEQGNLSGLDRHSTAVQQLEAALVASGKFVINGAVRLHLGQIVLAAYANSPAILAALTIVAAAI